MSDLPETSNFLQRFFTHPMYTWFRRPFTSKRLLFIGDLLLIIVSVMGSFALRLEWGSRFVYFLPQAWRMVALALLIKPLIYYFFGMYRRLWVYASMRELRLVVVAVSFASLLVSIATLGMIAIQLRSPSFLGFPRHAGD